MIFTREFSHGSCNPPCNVTCCCSHQLAPEKYERSVRRWMISNEFTTARVDFSRPRPNWRNSPDCRARAERAISSFYRGETWKIRSRWATRSNFQLPSWDIGRRIERNASLAGKICSLTITNFRIGSARGSSSSSSSSCFSPPHYFFFHSIFTLTLVSNLNTFRFLPAARNLLPNSELLLT